MLKNQWQEILEEEFCKQYFIRLWKTLEIEYQNHIVYPSKENLFTAFALCDYCEVKVVILGQDPYINPNQAHGLAFSVMKGTPLPPSLRNIYKEVETDMGHAMSHNGTLSSWAKQGVFLLNVVLSVRKGQSKSHFHLGWENFTNAVIEKLNMSEQPIVFLLWGNDALAKIKLITSAHHLVLFAPHPSPLSSFRGFFGCKHFSKANAFLIENNRRPIDWRN